MTTYEALQLKLSSIRNQIIEAEEMAFDLDSREAGHLLTDARLFVAKAKRSALVKEYS